MTARLSAELPVPTENKTHAALVSVWWTGVMLKKAADRFFRPFGSSEAQFNILWLIRHAEGPLTQREIGERLVVDKSNITGLIDRMSKAGLVRRAPVQGDRRSYHVQMTAKGGKLMEKMDAAYDQRVSQVMAGLSGEEMDEILRLTEKMRQGLTEPT